MALVFLRLKVSLAAVKTAISRAPAARAALVALCGWERGPAAARPAGRPTRRSTSSEPAICGTHCGETKAPDLDHGQAGVEERLAEGDAVVHGEGGRLVLQAVPRAHLHHGDARRGRLASLELHQHHARRHHLAQPATWTAFTPPSRGARSAFSIFIASTTSSSSPLATAWPGCHLHRDDLARHRAPPARPRAWRCAARERPRAPPRARRRRRARRGGSAAPSRTQWNVSRARPSRTTKRPGPSSSTATRNGPRPSTVTSRPLGASPGPRPSNVVRRRSAGGSAPSRQPPRAQRRPRGRGAAAGAAGPAARRGAAVQRRRGRRERLAAAGRGRGVSSARCSSRKPVCRSPPRKAGWSTIACSRARFVTTPSTAVRRSAAAMRCDRLRAVAAPGHELGQQRVVVHGHLASPRGDARVEADARAPRAPRGAARGPARAGRRGRGSSA